MNTNEVLNKLIAEIERLREPNQPFLSDFENGCIEGHNNVLDDILSIIASLQQEQSEVNFEKEYKSYMKSRKDDLSGNAVTVNMKDMARHFYERGLTARKEE